MNSLSMRVGERFGCSRDQLLDFIFRREIVDMWLGEGVRLGLRDGRTVRLPDHTGRLRWGRLGITDNDSKYELSVQFNGAQDSSAKLRFTIASVAPGKCLLKVEECGLPDSAAVKDSLYLWQDKLDRLASLVRSLLDSRRSIRQAVIVIHGIGESQPGQTLREFTDAVFPAIAPDARIRRVKPDYRSKHFETRKVTVESDGRIPRTDVYELYWAHLLRGTSIWPVLAWMFKLLFTPRRLIRRSLHVHVTIIWTVIGIAALVACASWIWSRWPEAQRPNPPGWVPEWLVPWLPLLVSIVVLLSWVVWNLVGRRVLVHWVGDATRYFQPKPDNIAARQQIRDAGVDLLESLHRSGKYARIIVVGHSLGSAIGYDILNFAWLRFGRHHHRPSRTSSAALEALECRIRLEPAVDGNLPPEEKERIVNERQELQHQAWAEARWNGMPWLVTDFITAGSPLTHAEILLSPDRKYPFRQQVEDRVLPQCPPLLEHEKATAASTDQEAAAFGPGVPADLALEPRLISFPAGFRSNVTGKRVSMKVPHHAGVFAYTRWTNLYFEHSRILRGDPVGGPLSGLMGRWIHDIPLSHTKFAHTRYWDDPNAEHVVQLRSALRLVSSMELKALRDRLPLKPALDE